jgi:hypothetical protein
MAGLDVTVYFVMTEPPLNAGATHDTFACPLTPLTVAVCDVGTPGITGAIANEYDSDVIPL